MQELRVKLIKGEASRHLCERGPETTASFAWHNIHPCG